jgi:hypothetical protein
MGSPMPKLPEYPVPTYGDTMPQYTAEQLEVIRAVDRFRSRHKRPVRFTEVVELLKGLGYRKLPPDLVGRFDRGELAG